MVTTTQGLQVPYLDAQGSYNQAVSVVIESRIGPLSRVGQVIIGFKYSYGLKKIPWASK